MKQFFYILFLTIFSFLFGQLDTIVVSDYAKVMVSTGVERDGVSPVTSLDGLTQIGTFLHNLPGGSIRICNDEEIFVWVNGKLMMNVHGCTMVDSKEIFSKIKSDTLFLSFTTHNKFSNFRCELVRFEKLHVVKDNILNARMARNPFTEFIIISLIIILVFVGIWIRYYPSRISYILEKTFTLKTNAYEFINTNFLSGPSLIAAAILSLTLGFLGIYLNELLGLNILDKNQSITDFLWGWVELTFMIFLLLFFKRFLIGFLSRLFQLKGLSNYQMFDFLNFNLFFFIPIAFLVVIDFVLFLKGDSWISVSTLLAFPIVLIFFQVWFAFKLVNQSPRRKLIIISYLCATEIMPAVFLLGWFFK